MNLQEAKKLLKDNGYVIIKEELAEAPTKLDSEKQKLLFNELTAIKNELTAEESKLVGLDAILSNFKNGHAANYEEGRISIVVHDKEYEDNPTIFKKYFKLAKERGFDVTIKYCKWGVFIELDWLF
jgi:hypothetical protein